MIQVPFNSSCVALQYETGTKFFPSSGFGVLEVKDGLDRTGKKNR